MSSKAVDSGDDYELEQEKKHFCKIVTAYKSYKKYMLRRIEEKEKYVKGLPPAHQSLLDSYMRHLDQQKTGVMHNAEVIRLIITDVENMFENVQHAEIDDVELSDILNTDLEKVQSTLKHIVRDWSAAGEKERSMCYAPLIRRVEALYPSDKVCLQDVNILVPGAGLGRLAYEFARRGYTCQGNEFSLFMLFASNFVLNKLQGINCLQIYPWVHAGSNLWRNSDQLNLVSFPDVEPSNLPSSANFSMAAGDFLEIYKEDKCWDCVVTCFFVDCASNIVSFIETIYNILKPGGHWVNLGPLLYHYADIPGENSIEPTYEIVQQIIRGVGFKILEEKLNIRTTYTQNDASMLSYEYSSVYFSVQKPC